MKKMALLLAAVIGLAACLPPLPKALTLGNIRLPLVGQEDRMWAAEDYEGKPVLIVFMGSWCPYCKMTMPAVNVIAEEYGDRVEIVTVFMDANPKAVATAAKEHNLTVKALYNGGELAETMEVQGLPHTVLFDKKHRAIKHWEGFDPDRVNHFRDALKKVAK